MNSVSVVVLDKVIYNHIFAVAAWSLQIGDILLYVPSSRHCNTAKEYT